MLALDLTLAQWFSPFPMLSLFDTGPYVVVIPGLENFG